MTKPNNPLRRSDRQSIAVLVLSVCTVLIITGPLLAQVPNFDRGVHDRVVQDIERRIQNIESLRVPERLAVIESAIVESTANRRLIYGLLAGVVGSLLAQIVQIRDARKRRGRD